MKLGKTLGRLAPAVLAAGLLALGGESQAGSGYYPGGYYPGGYHHGGYHHGGYHHGGQKSVRFATFNASLNRGAEGQLAAELADPANNPNDATVRAIAEIIQRAEPDVLLINEFDFDAAGAGIAAFQRNYLSVSQNGADPIEFPYVFNAPSNTGIPSGFDLDNQFGAGGPGDAFGFGFFPGQFAMVLLSKYPIDERRARTFQTFLWKDLPGALLPDDPATPEPADWFTAEELEVVRLSSKSHWDVPIKVGRETIHALVSHPTPPVFDGPEDRNGTRNHDEIRFWAEYIRPGRKSRFVYDDKGRRGGLRWGAKFVIMGDQNADPFDGDSTNNAARLLTENRRINNRSTPASAGGPEAAAVQGGINADHLGDPAFDTADFGDTAPGNLRVDYTLPSRNLRILDSGVFWPEAADPLSSLATASDHRLVWVDIKIRSRRFFFDDDGRYSHSFRRYYGFGKDD